MCFDILGQVVLLLETGIRAKSLVPSPVLQVDKDYSLCPSKQRFSKYGVVSLSGGCSGFTNI